MKKGWAKFWSRLITGILLICFAFLGYQYSEKKEELYDRIDQNSLSVAAEATRYETRTSYADDSSEKEYAVYLEYTYEGMTYSVEYMKFDREADAIAMLGEQVPVLINAENPSECNPFTQEERKQMNQNVKAGTACLVFLGILCLASAMKTFKETRNAPQKECPETRDTCTGNSADYVNKHMTEESAREKLNIERRDYDNLLSAAVAMMLPFTLVMVLYGSGWKEDIRYHEFQQESAAVNAVITRVQQTDDFHYEVYAEYTVDEEQFEALYKTLTQKVAAEKLLGTSCVIAVSKENPSVQIPVVTRGTGWQYLLACILCVTGCALSRFREKPTLVEKIGEHEEAFFLELLTYCRRRRLNGRALSAVGIVQVLLFIAVSLYELRIQLAVEGLCCCLLGWMISSKWMKESNKVQEGNFRVMRLYASGRRYDNEAEDYFVTYTAEKYTYDDRAGVLGYREVRQGDYIYLAFVGDAERHTLKFGPFRSDPAEK